MRKFFLYVFLFLLLAGFAGCDTPTADLPLGTSMKNEVESPNTTTIAEKDKEVASLLSDEKLVDRMLYLLDVYIHPVAWWVGAGAGSYLDVWEIGAEPLEGTPEGTTFYRVMRFDSIDEMKRATEQAVTKEFAEKNLYPCLEEYHQFLERDGRLYINTSAGLSLWPFAPESATVLSKSEDTVQFSVVFVGGSGNERYVREVEMKFEDQTWKLNSSPYLPQIAE